MDKKKYVKTVQNAIKWLAAEFAYMKEERKDLEDLRRDIASAKKKEALRDIRKAQRLFRYIGRAERREHRYEHALESALMELSKRTVAGTFQEVRKLEEEIHMVAESIFKETSLYRGNIKIRLLKMRSLAKANLVDALKKELSILEQEVDNTITWMNGLQTDYQKAEKLAA